jgi:hypothetical protein
LIGCGWSACYHHPTHPGQSSYLNSGDHPADQNAVSQRCELGDKRSLRKRKNVFRHYLERNRWREGNRDGRGGGREREKKKRKRTRETENEEEIRKFKDRAQH